MFKAFFSNRGESGLSAVAAISAIVVVGALFTLPQVLDNPYAIHIMILLFLSIIMGESWNILGGYAGQYSVGHAAYFGAGAYTTMMLMQFARIPPWYGMWLGIVAAVILALCIGSICFRLRGPYFVLASIAAAEIVRLSALNLKEVTNGAEGILAADIPILRIGPTVVTDFLSKTPFYYTGLVLALLTIAVTLMIQHSKLGYYFQAIREDQDAAQSLGINLSLYKNLALVISASLTSLAGSLYAVYIGFIDPTGVLSLDMSVQIVLICIIGGIGTIFGPVVGSLILVPLSEALRSNILAQALFKAGLVSEESPTGLFFKDHLAHAHVLIYGILVVVVILFMPEGVLGFVKKVLSPKNRRSA